MLIIAFFLRERSEQVEDERVNVPAGVPEGEARIDADQSPVSAYSVHGNIFIYRCPNTGLRIQALAAEEITEGEDTYEAVTCIMCRQLEPAEHAREGGKERPPTAVRYVAIARRDAGYSDPPSLVDGAPDIVAVDGCDRPVCRALRRAALRLFGFIITAVAQTQEPTNLGVGSSNFSRRAKWINNLRQFSV